MSTSFEPRSFDEHLMNAVEASQTGFHFEEGGCWGMAAALHDVMSGAGVLAEIRYRPEDFVHAWVRAADADWDYRGATTSSSDGLVIESIDALRSVAASYGVDKDAFESDRAMASEIVKAAMAMSAAAGSAPKLSAAQPGDAR